jgi:hypothetical protein
MERLGAFSQPVHPNGVVLSPADLRRVFEIAFMRRKVSFNLLGQHVCQFDAEVNAAAAELAFVLQKPDLNLHTIRVQVSNDKDGLLVRAHDPDDFVYVLEVGCYPAFECAGWMHGGDAKRWIPVRATHEAPGEADLFPEIEERLRYLDHVDCLRALTKDLSGDPLFLRLATWAAFMDKEPAELAAHTDLVKSVVRL